MPSLAAVLLHYNTAPTPFTGHSDLVPLEFDGEQIAALEAFLGTLSAPTDAPPERLVDPSAP